MAQNLSDIAPSELSFVRRGAVRRPFLFMKGDDEPEVEVTADVLAAFAKEHGIDPDELVKAMGDEEPAESDEYADIAKAEQPVYKRDFTAEQRRELAREGSALPDGSYPIETKADLAPALTLARSGHGDTTAAKALISKRAKELGATDLLPDDWNVSKEDDMSETATAVPVQKEDGTWDLTAVPEENRAAVEAVIKAHDEEVAELRKQAQAEQSKAEEALEIAKAARDDQLSREFIAKAEEVGETAEFGEVLKTIAGAVELETFQKLESVLKANHERAKTAGLYEEIGKSGSGEGSASSELDAKADEIRKSDTSLTKEQALAKAYEQNPTLYARQREEA